MKSATNEKLAQGEAYTTKAGCLRAIELVQQSAAATLHDLSPKER